MEAKSLYSRGQTGLLERIGSDTRTHACHADRRQAHTAQRSAPAPGGIDRQLTEADLEAGAQLLLLLRLWLRLWL